MKTILMKRGGATLVALRLAILTLSVLALPMSAGASVVYQFEFTDLVIDNPFARGDSSGFQDFQLTLEYEHYVTDLGLKPIKGAAQPTSFGYVVQFAGANPNSVWAFDDDNAAVLEENSMHFTGSALWVRFWSPQTLTDYIKAPGVYRGAVGGAVLVGEGSDAHLTEIMGNANLRVFESVVRAPEPSTLSLLFVAFMGVYLKYRRSNLK